MGFGGSRENRDFERSLERFQKDYSKNVAPELKLHKFALSRTERRRVKDRLAEEKKRRADKRRMQRHEGLFHRQ